MTSLCLTIAGVGLACQLGATQAPERASPEARAVAFLSREVPDWSRENRCFSCHNNGDAARALYRAARLGHRVPAEALADTTAWLARPSGWDRNGGEGPFSDKRLARVAFTASLAEAARAGSIADRATFREAGVRLVRDQAADGSWPPDGEGSPGSPAAYSRTLATFLARESLDAADPIGFRDAIARADAWLIGQEPVTTGDTGIDLIVSSRRGGTAAAARRNRAIERLRRAQSEDGGWGPYDRSPPEPFDTAVALLALARSGDRSHDPTRRMLARGRAFLITTQHDDGSWTETTRPAGGTSYAQRISTTGWATLALLATGDIER